MCPGLLPAGLPVLYQQQLVLLLFQLNFQQFLYNRTMPGLSFPLQKYVPFDLVFLLPGSFWQFALTARLLLSVLYLLSLRSVPACSGVLSHLHGQLFCVVDAIFPQVVELLLIAVKPDDLIP